MAEPTQPPQTGAEENARSFARSNSFSAASQNSQTAAEFINSQLQLEADAREALPYQFDTCTKPMGPLRQSLFSCLTCKPPPADPSEPYTPAGVCYSCSISCHGEHTLVELFSKRNFVCDCGTTRFPETSPCTLRANEETGTKGGVHSETPSADNKYNHNFRNRFCGCEEEYDPHQEKGIMFQCLGLGTVEDGGCGEDWWHPECVLGISRQDYQKSVEAMSQQKKETKVEKEEKAENGLASIQEEKNGDNAANAEPAAPAGEEDEDEDTPLPPGFPKEDDFDTFLCYKCVNAFPWIKQYAHSVDGFLPPVFYKPQGADTEVNTADTEMKNAPLPETASSQEESKKRKVADDGLEVPDSSKRQKSEVPAEGPVSNPTKPVASSTACKLTSLPPAPSGTLSIFLKEDFRNFLCRCPSCFPLLKQHPQLLEEEDTYEPPISEEGDGQGGASVGTGSLLDRGEAALSNMDRVRAIEGAMVYAHLKDKVKEFLKPFADSGEAVGAEHIKAYFETLRGDAEGIREARGGAAARKDGRDEGGDDGPDNRKEQSGESTKSIERLYRY